MSQSATYTRTRIFTKDFVLLVSANFISCAIYFLMITMTAGYAIAMFSCSEAMAGWAASIFMIGAVLGRLIAGHIKDSLCHLAAVVCISITAISCGLYFLTSTSYLFLLVVRVIHGTVFGLGTTMTQLLAMRGMPPERLGEGVGYFTLSVTLGTAIGPMMGLFVVSGLSYDVLFAGSTAAALLGILLMLLVSKSTKQAGSHAVETASIESAEQNNEYNVKPHANTTNQERSGGFSIFTFIDKGTWSFSLFILILGIAYAPLNAFLAAYASDIGMAMFAPFVFLVYACVLVFSRPIAGMILDRRGWDFVLIPSIIFMIAGLVLCGLVQNPFMLLLVGVFMALGFGTSMSCSQAAATKMSIAQGSTTMAVSTQFVMADLGNALGPALMGIVATAADYRVMWFACAGVALLSLCYFIIQKKVTGRPSQLHVNQQ